MASKKKCVTCGKGFIAKRADAKTCSTACRSKAHRRAVRTVTNDTDKAAPSTAASPLASPPAEHTAEALAVLAGLDAELAENAVVLGEPLTWSQAETTVRGLIADSIDRRVSLQQRYASCDDTRLSLSIAVELRLLEASIARLLKQIKTEMPVPPSAKSRKAAAAANTRHHGPGSA